MAWYSEVALPCDYTWYSEVALPCDYTKNLGLVLQKLVNANNPRLKLTKEFKSPLPNSVQC